MAELPQKPMGIAAKSTLVDDVHFSPGSEYEAIRIIC
jgi:hypothetical protein